MKSPSVTVRRANTPAIVVGVFLLGTATLGLIYNATTMFAALQDAFGPMLLKGDLPYFYLAFIIMSAICVCCYIAILVCGVDLVRSRLRWARLVTLIMVFEVGYFFAVGWLWLEPTIGHSIGAATGVANGGLMAQFLILLPLWAPLVLWWAKSRQ